MKNKKQIRKSAARRYSLLIPSSLSKKKVVKTESFPIVRIIIKRQSDIPEKYLMSVRVIAVQFVSHHVVISHRLGRRLERERRRRRLGRPEEGPKVIRGLLGIFEVKTDSAVTRYARGCAAELYEARHVAFDLVPLSPSFVLIPYPRPPCRQEQVFQLLSDARRFCPLAALDSDVEDPT